jgi:phage terminase large subunit
MAQIKPTKPQYDYIMSNSKFPALVAGFGAGKTEAAVKRAIVGKLMHPEVNRGFYEPTYDLIRMIAFPRFEEALEDMKIPYRLYKSPLNYIDFGEGMGKIFFRSMDSPGRIIGYEHGDADVDELDTLKLDDAADVWRRILSRNRQRKADKSPNTIGVTTTPEGFRFVYQTWGKDIREGYELIRASTLSNPYLPAEYVDNLRAIYPPQLLEAYLEGMFVNLTSGTVYNGYDRTHNRSDETINPKEPLYIGMDFNVTNMSAVVYVQRGEEWHAVEELKGIYDTPAMIEIIQEKYKEHNITVYPDASGKNRKSVNASTSDIALLKHAGFRVKAKESNPFVKDRVMAANAAFSYKRVLVNDNACPEFANCLEQLAYDKNNEPDKGSNLDHLPDAGSYMIAYEMPVRKPVANIKVSFR